MGDGTAPIPTALPPAPPPPPPPIEGKDIDEKSKASDGGAPAPGPAAPPPNEQELKKITTEVISAGVKLPPELLDPKGNIKPDQVAAAKKFIADEASKRKDKDLGAASRLYQRALKLDPEDKSLRLEAAKVTKAWADTQKKPDVKKALLGDAISLLKPGKEDADQIGLLGDYARELAGLHLRDGKLEEARQVLAGAAPKLNVEELDKTYAFLTAPENADLLEEGQHPWMFLGDALMQEKNYELAAIAYTRGVNVAQKDKNFPLRDEFNNKFSLAHEAEHPYQTEFADPASGQVSNAAANAFFRSLQAQGIPASAMDKEVEGKSDGKISVKEVYAYIGDHLDDPKVQAVLAMAKINIAEEDKKSVKVVGFGLWMSDYYTKQAERLKKEDPEKNAAGIAKLLTFAVDLDPENPKRAEALGDFYSEQKAYPLAMQAYAEAVKAYKAMPPPDKNPRAMEGFTQMQGEAAKRLKGKIDDMFDKGLKATGVAYEKEGTDLPTKLQLVQTLEGQYEIYGELYPDDAQKPDRIRQMGLTYDLIAQNLQAAGKKSEAKAYYAKAAEKYQLAINANKNDAVFCIHTYKMMGNAKHQIGDYKGALIAYSLAAQCQKLRIHYKSGGQLPSLASVKQDRAPGQLVSESSLGNYIHSDVHDIRSVEGLDTLPHWAEGSRENYIHKLQAEIDGGPAARQAMREQNPPNLQGIYDSLEVEARLLAFFERGDEAKKIGEEAAQTKLQLDHQQLSAQVESLNKSGLLDKKGLDAVADKENKGQATPLKFSDYVKFERSGDKVTFKFTPEYEKLDVESQNRVMHAMMSAAQRNQISRNAEKAKGPAKLFYEGQLAVFDEDRATAKTKFEQFAKEAKGTQDPVLLRMLQQTEGVMQILEKDGKQKPSDVMRDLRIVLAPLAMTLKPGQDGGLDLSAISTAEVKTFDDFRQYLASQVSVDGVNFNAAIFASYEKVLKSPKHEALLRHLYAEFNSGAVGEAPKMTTEQLQAALRDFQRDIIDVSPGRFVGNRLSNKEGRARLRDLLQDETLDRGIRAKLCEEIVEQGQAQGYASSAMVAAFDEKVNSHGFWLQEGKLDIALRYGFRVLNAGDHQDVARNKHIEKYEKYPQEVQRLQSDNLDHQVTPKSIQDMAKMVQAQSGKSDGVSVMRAKLGTMWLTVVDNDSWGVDAAVDRHKSRVNEKQRAEMANTLHALLSEADSIGTEQEFLAWSQRVRRFMRGQGSGKKDDLAATAGKYLGKGAEDLVGEAGEKFSWAVSDTTEDAFKGLKPSVASSYNDLLRYVDEVHVSNLHGVSVEVLDPDVSVTDPAQKEKTMKLIQDLRGMKRGFWYNYQQRNFLSRSMSEQGEMVGVGDITSINAANKEIDGIIADLQKAKTTEDFEKVKARMTRATREGGAIHTGFAESEMEGTEQVINLVQTIAEIVVITVATQGIGTEAALGRAAATFGQTALRTRNLRMAYQAFSEVRSVANMARAAETLEAANMARYGSLYREMQGVGRLGALAGEDAAIAKGFQGVFARGARAIGGEVGFGAKAASGFKMGATISLTENMIGSLSGQLKTDPTTLLDWLKDATATGLSMVVSAGLSPTVGEQVQQNIVKGLWQRYVAGGARSAVHFLADTGLEVVEEVVDNYVRKKLDGDFSKLSFDELRDITMVCFIGGVKQGVTSHFTNFTKAKIADYQVKKLHEGFSDRGERIVQDPKRGYVLVDREGRYLKKVDETAMQAFLVFDAETHGDSAKGVALVEFESGEKGVHGKPVQVALGEFPVVQGDAPPKSAAEIKKEKEERTAIQQERAVAKAKNEKQRKLYGQFLEKGEKIQEVKRTDGVVIGLALVDSKGKKVRDATVDELAAYQRYVQLVEGFETRKEKVFGNQAQGFYLADTKGNKIGDASQADLSLYLKFKKKQANAEARTNIEAAQKKAYDERESVRLGEYEAGYGYRLKKRRDGVTLGVEKFDARSGKAVETDKSPSKEDLESYQGWVGQRAEAKSKTDAETKLQEGFGEGQRIVLNADTGKYELQDAKGKKLRVATDAEQKLFSEFQTKKQEHEVAIGKRAEELAPEFDAGVQIRPKVDKYESCKQDDPNATPVEGADKKVTYYVKVKPDGTRERLNQKDIGDIKAGRQPEILGFEKVDKEGKVVDGPPVPKSDYEAFQLWQKNKATAEAVAKAEKQDAEGSKILPFPAREGGQYLSEAALRDARAQAAGHAYDHLAGQGPVSLEVLLKRTQDAVDSLRYMEPALAKLSEADRARVQEGIVRQVSEGKMTREQAMELAERLQVGEAQLVPSAKGEYGFEVKSNPKGQPPGIARFRPITEVEAKAAKIAKAAPSPERIARYKEATQKNVEERRARLEKFFVEKKGYSPLEAREMARKAIEEWPTKVIEDARAHQAGRTHIYDTSLPMKPENAHLDTATVDHHGRFANKKNSTEQLVDRMEATLDQVKSDPKALAEAKKDKAAMDEARKGLQEAGVKEPSDQQVAEIAAAMRKMNLREVTTDNLADGAWSVWIAKHQARVLADPALRKTINEATHFEDFTAFGTTYSEKDPGVRMQAALFQKYGEILQRNGIVGSDRFPPDKAHQVMGEALAAIDRMVADPAAREQAAGEFFTKVEEARQVAGTDALMKDASVHEGDVNLSVFDLTKLGKYTVFQQWLALPRVQVVEGQPHTMQVSVVPLGKAKLADGTVVDAPRTLQIVAIPDGRSLPSGKTMLAALERMNALELAKAEELGLVPKQGEAPKPGQYSRDEYSKVWFGKDNVILPNPAKGTLLSPKEVSQILTDRGQVEVKIPLTQDFNQVMKEYDDMVGRLGKDLKAKEMQAMMPAWETKLFESGVSFQKRASGDSYDVIGPDGKGSGRQVDPDVVERFEAWKKNKEAPLGMFVRKAVQGDAIQGAIEKALPADPDGTKVEGMGRKPPANDNDAQLMPSEVDRTPADSPVSKRGGKLTAADEQFSIDILPSALYRGVYRPAADIQSKGEMVRLLEDWVTSADAPKTPAERKKFLEDLHKGHRGEPGGKVLLILDGEVHIETPERARARLEWRDTMLGALQSTTREPAKALKEWLEGPDAPKTFEAREKFAEDLARGARGEPDGKVLMVDSGGKVRVETFADVKGRLEAGKEFIAELSKGKTPPPREVQEALLWRAALNAGKSPADVRADLAYAVEQFPKLREQIEGLPKEVARDLSLRFLRGELSFFNAKQFSATFRQARVNAEKLGISAEQFDTLILKQAQQWQADYGAHPSMAVEASLRNTAPTLEVLGQAAALMTPENRNATMQRFVDGKITLDQAYEVMTAQTLGATFDAVEGGIKPQQAKELILSTLDGVYPPKAPTHIRKTWENYLKSQDPMTVLEERFSGIAFNLQLAPDTYVKLAESLNGLDPQSQASLLVYLNLRMEKLFGPASTSGGITTADRANAETLFRGTQLLAKQLKGLDPAGRQKLVAELLSGKPSLEMAIMDADLPLVRPAAADGDGTRVEKLPPGVASGDVTPIVTVKPLASEGKVLPFKPKAPSDAPPAMKVAADTNSKVEGVGSRIVKVQGDAKATDEVLKPFDAVAEQVKGDDAKLAERLSADLNTLRSADPKSKEYQDALARMGELEGSLKVLNSQEMVAPEKVSEAVRKVYEKPVDISEDPTVRLSGSGLSGPAAILLGALTVLAPDVAKAAEGPLKSAAERGGMGPTEAVMILGIGTLIGLPFVAKYLKARYGEASKAPTREAPLQVEQDGKTYGLYPQGKGAKPGTDERSARINKENSSVVGDKVYVALEYASGDKAQGPIGEKGTLLPMTRAEAESLGIKFDKAGNIVSVPKDPVLVKQPKVEAPPPIDVVADAGPPPAVGKSVILDPLGRPLSEVQPLTVGEAKTGAPAQSFGKILSAEPVEGDPKKVVVTVETYSPNDPLADPTGLAFGIGKQPKAIERRQFVLEREAAIKSFGLQEPIAGQALKLPNNPYVVINDSVGLADPSHPVVVRDSSAKARVLYPADRAGQKGIDGTQIWVDPANVSYLDGQFHVFYERGDFTTGKVHKEMEPLVLTSDQARRLGITVDHEGKIVHGKLDKEGKLTFVMGKFEVGKDDKILLDGKPFDAEHGPVSVRIEVGKEGIRFVTQDGKEVDPPAPKGAMLSGTAEGQSKLVAAAKAAGPLGVALLMMFSPETAHAASVESVVRVAETMGLGGLGVAAGIALSGLIGMAWFGRGGGGKPPQPNHPAIKPVDGVTGFSVGIDASGRPTMNPVVDPAMTFERGPQGQWYYYEGRPPKTYNESKGDPQALAGWKPVKDGDIYGISDVYGRKWILPFEAPKDAWIPGYAPPQVADGIIPAASGKLPVGKVSLLRMKDDGSPLVIGRGEGDLRFDDTSVSGVHATIIRDPDTGQHYLIDGAYGSSKTSTNGVVYSGVKMSDLPPQYRKAVPIHPGDYFAINGAYFKFEPSPVQPVKAGDHPMGFPAVKMGNQDFSMRLINFKDTMLFGPESIHGSIQGAHSYPNDPQGRVVLTLGVYRPSNILAGESRMVLELTRDQAAQLGIKLTPQGKLDPSMQGKMVSFSPIQALQAAAYAQPAPAQYGAKVEAKFGNQTYDLQVYQQGMPWDAKRDFGGEVQGAEPLRGDPQGRFFVKVGYRDGNDTNAPVKTLLYNLTSAEAYSLGLRFDSTGKLDTSRKYWLKVTPREVQGAAPAPKVAPAPKPGLVSIDPATGLPKGVYGALGDNVPGQTPRRGELRGKLPAGTYAARTHEGMGKDYNEDGFVQGRDFAVVIDEVGTGGSHGQASKIFGQAVSKYIEANRGTMEPGKLLTEAFRAGNDAINASPNSRSSVVAVAQMVVKQPDGSYKAYIIHRGDARAMVVDKEGKILHVTKDESVVEMTHGEAKVPGEYELELKKRADPGGNVVLGALGGGHKFVEKITVTELDLPPGARIVMASDGVTDSVSSKELAGIVAKTDDAGKAMDEGFQLGLTKMSEGLDAAEMLKFRSDLDRIDKVGYVKVEFEGEIITTDRAPLMSGGELRYVRREYNDSTKTFEYRVYDAPVGGKELDKYTRGEKLPERLPVTTPEGEQRYIDTDYNLWDHPTGGKMVDHYKPSDNITLHVYIHDPEGKLPKPSGSDRGGGGPPPPSKPRTPPPSPPRPFTVGGQKKNLTGPKSAGPEAEAPVFQGTFSGNTETIPRREDGSYEILPGVLVRKNAQGRWELADTRDAAVLAAAPKFNIGDTMIGDFSKLAETAPVKVNGKELKPGESVVLQPGDRISGVLQELQFTLPGPKAWDGELTKAAAATRQAAQKKLAEAKSFVEIKTAVTESGLPGGDKILADIDACLDGRLPVSSLPQALQEPMLRNLEAQSKELAQRVPAGYKPELDPNLYRGGVDPRERRFHTLKAAVLYAQEFEMAGSVSELRRLIDATPLMNPEGLDKTYLRSRLERFEKGEIGIQDIPAGLGLRQKVRDLWEAKNLRLMEGGPDSGRPKDPAAEAALQNLDSRAMDIYAELGRIGPVKGSAKTYSIVELRELVYEVLERGKPLEQLPTNKGVRAMVENYMRTALAEARYALRDNLDFKKNFFTGEDFKARDFKGKGGADFTESLQAKYRFIRMYLNQKAGRPVYGDPSPREMELLSRFARQYMGKQGLGKYSEYQAFIRDELGRLTPQMQSALRHADPETRELVVEAFFGASRHRQVSDVPQALKVATFLGKIGYHREIGITGDIQGGALRINLTLGDVAHVTPEDAHLFFLLHTHPNDYSSGKGGAMGINQTMALGQAIANNSTLNVLFSSQDIRVYLRQAQDIKVTADVYKDADLSAFYDRKARVFRNWVQHSDGISQAEVLLGADGKPQSVRIRYGLYPHADIPRFSNSDHLYQAEKLRQLSRQLGVPVFVERVAPATLEAELPTGQK